MSRAAPATEVAVIGAGFAGLGMAIGLRGAGIDDFVILERAGNLGGTWRDNTYPGCACDVAAHLYSFSFAPNPDWTRVYAPWHEIQAYLQRTADEHGLRRHLRLHTEVTALHFDEQRALWRLTTAAGERLTARHVVNATGPLSRPSLPAIEGRESFAGHAFHSAAWDHDYPLAGKRVAVIGTGASAIQIIPAIAPQVRALTVFQRSAPWVVPRYDRAYGPLARRLLRHSALRRALRWLTYWRYELFGFGIIGYRFASRLLERLGRWQLERQVADPALREQLRPDFQIGCKRILVSDDYYPALTRGNVALVTSGIERITAAGVVDGDGVEHELDAIVYATGFRATDFLAPMRVHGRGGLELRAAWARSAAHYLGIHLSGFPNLHLLLGPNTGLGHNSVVFMLEAQIAYILRAIRRARLAGGAALDVRAPVQRAYSEGLQQALRGTSWLSGCRSWYLDEHGRNTTLWPGFSLGYWWRTRGFESEDYELLRPPAPAIAAACQPTSRLSR